MGTFHYEAPTAPEDFTRGELLGWDIANDVVRRIQAGDPFAGHVLESFDRTGLANGVNTHAQPGVGTMPVAVGTLELQPASGVTTELGREVYAASPTTYSHDPAAGAFIGFVIKPWLGHGSVGANAGFWILDTKPGYFRTRAASPLQYFTLRYDDQATAVDECFVSPVAGVITLVTAINGPAITAGPATYSVLIDGTTVTGGDITFPAVHPLRTGLSATPTADNAVAVGESVCVQGDGGGDLGEGLGFVITIQVI